MSQTDHMPCIPLVASHRLNFVYFQAMKRSAMKTIILALQNHRLEFNSPAVAVLVPSEGSEAHRPDLGRRGSMVRRGLRARLGSTDRPGSDLRASTLRVKPHGLTFDSSSAGVVGSVADVGARQSSVVDTTEGSATGVDMTGSAVDMMGSAAVRTGSAGDTKDSAVDMMGSEVDTTGSAVDRMEGSVDEVAGDVDLDQV